MRLAAERDGESRAHVNQRLLATKRFLNRQKYLLTGGQCQALMFKGEPVLLLGASLP